jgi:hypothetical protein
MRLARQWPLHNEYESETKSMTNSNPIKYTAECQWFSKDSAEHVISVVVSAGEINGKLNT